WDACGVGGGVQGFKLADGVGFRLALSVEALNSRTTESGSHEPFHCSPTNTSVRGLEPCFAGMAEWRMTPCSPWHGRINQWSLSAAAQPISFEPLDRPERPINREPLPGIGRERRTRFRLGGIHALVAPTGGRFGRADGFSPAWHFQAGVSAR